MSCLARPLAQCLAFAIHIIQLLILKFSTSTLWLSTRFGATIRVAACRTGRTGLVLEGIERLNLNCRLVGAVRPFRDGFSDLGRKSPRMEGSDDVFGS